MMILQLDALIEAIILFTFIFLNRLAGFIFVIYTALIFLLPLVL